MGVRFRVLGETTPEELERQLNRWADELPPGTKVRRTQLCCSDRIIFALVNYELPEAKAD